MSRQPDLGDEKEHRRLAALHRYDILDTGAESTYDDVTRIAAQICDTPIALISLVDETRQWFKSRVGLDVRETPREIAFCTHAIEQEALFEVCDASIDDRFRDNPLVTGAPDIRYYAGVPLATPDGHNLGTLCVIDRKPRRLSQAQRAALDALARQVTSQMEVRRALAEVERARALLAEEIERRATLELAQTRSERSIRETLDALPDNIAVIDQSGTIVRVNQAWLNFARQNAAPSQLGALGPGANYLAVCEANRGSAASGGAAMATAIRDAFLGRSGESIALEYPCHSPTEQRWFLGRVSAFEDGVQRYAVISHTDITRRVHVEQQHRALNATLEARIQARTRELERINENLRASEDRFRSLFEGASVGFAIVASDGRLVEVNPAFAHIVDRPGTALQGMSLFDLIVAEEQAELRAQLSHLERGAQPSFLRTFRLALAQGEIVWVHISLASFRAGSGPAQMVALVQNVTSHRRAVYERDAFFDLSIDMFVIGGFDGSMQRVNPACARILGYSQDELLGMSYLDLVHDDDREPTRRRLADLTQERTEPSTYFDVRMRTKSGEYRDIHWSVSAWASAEKIIAVGTDITMVQRAEREQRALAARLQQIREEERTLISREIHDELGQMLTAIKMDMTLFKRDLLDDGPRSQRERLAAEVSSMDRLIDATLQSVKRIAWQLRPEVLDALGLVPAVKWQANEVQGRTGIKMTLDVPDSVPHLDDAQRTALFRILQEALTNVVRHAQATYVTISILADADTVRLIVGDDGCGFDPSTAGGTSLGLVGIRERAAGIGASVTIDSRPAGGTTIAVDVPLTSTR